MNVSPVALFAAGLALAVVLARSPASAQAAPRVSRDGTPVPALTLQLAGLERERAGLDWTTPSALHVTGGVLAGGAALTALGAAIFTPMSRTLTLDPDAQHDDTLLHTTLVGCAVTAVVGAVLLLAGVVIRNERVGRARAIDDELEYLRRVAIPFER